MQGQPVIAIFDIGKTNKKLFLFDERYNIVYERSAQFAEITDEEGDACENLEEVEQFLFESLHAIFDDKNFDIRAINCSAYGASFVYIDDEGKPLTPLYNYLKQYPEALKKRFYEAYGGEEKFSRDTASPVLGSLNSGMQLYRIKEERPELFARMKYALHLPQYIVYCLTKKALSEITSIGSHTNLWNFATNSYHEWVYKEGVINKFPPIVDTTTVTTEKFKGKEYIMGTGLHDSSAALIPYLLNFRDPFVLISTGTWCISLNPFNTHPLTSEELKNDCLCYLQYKGSPVKASRLFAGHEHEEQVKKIAAFFHQDRVYFDKIAFDSGMIQQLKKKLPIGLQSGDLINTSVFAHRDLNSFSSSTEAYHQLMLDIIAAQYASTQLVLRQTSVKKMYVDGGFSRNAVYMNLLASVFPDMKVFAASMANATAVGTALAISSSWNSKALPENIIDLVYFPVASADRVL
jgi:sugar (pentulose or hexulose) kinase